MLIVYIADVLHLSSRVFSGKNIMPPAAFKTEFLICLSLASHKMENSVDLQNVASDLHAGQLCI